MEIEYKNIVNKKNIIDIRSSLYYYSNNINGSINIPKMILLSNPHKYLNKMEEFYLLCDKGVVSLTCVKILNAMGYNCFSVKGGIDNLKI